MAAIATAAAEASETAHPAGDDAGLAGSAQRSVSAGPAAAEQAGIAAVTAVHVEAAEAGAICAMEDGRVGYEGSAAPLWPPAPPSP
ncbi:hypothetical protein H7I94_13975 [Mycobacterium szulgai]|nr:hypothetical protein [Mycobacterium szulgai]